MEKTKKRKLSVRLLALLLTVALLVTGCSRHTDAGETVDSAAAGGSNAELATEEATKQEQLSESADLYFAGMEENQQVGVSDYRIAYEGTIGYAVQYPVIGNDQIDALIDQEVSAMIREFEKDFQNGNQEEEGSQGDITDILYISYESYLGPDQTMGLAFERYVDTRGANTMPEDIKTYNFSLETFEEMSPEDIFMDNYREKAGAYIRDYLRSSEEYKDAVLDEFLEEKTSNEKENLNRFVLTPDGVKFYFNKYEVTAGYVGTVKVLIPYEEIEDVMRADVEEEPVLPDPNVGASAGEEEPSAPEKETEERIIDPEKPMVALTFDDGPHKTNTDRILDVLEENHAVATFFELGNLVLSYPEAVQRAESLGCEVGSHSWSHKNLNNLSKKELKADFKKTNNAFKKVLGHGVEIMRPPYGNCAENVRSVIKTPMFLWSVDTLDWKTKNKKKIIKEVKKAGNLDGKVILMHSIYDTSAEAAEYLIPWLIQEGYQLVTVSELVEYGYGDQVEEGKVYGYSYFSGR